MEDFSTKAEKGQVIQSAMQSSGVLLDKDMDISKKESFY